MKFLLLCFCLIVEVIGQTTPVVVTTTSGKLQGTDENGGLFKLQVLPLPKSLADINAVMSFKGVVRIHPT